MTPKPHLQLLDTSTGELLEDDRDFTLEELTKKYHGALGEIGRLKKEMRELRAVEPEAEVIRDILEYCRERVGKPGQHIIEGGDRWEKVRARLRDRLDGRGSWTPGELKLAADGALLEPYLNGTAYKAPKDGRYLDAKTIYRDGDQVQKLRDLALGFKAQAGVGIGDILDLTDELRVVSWRHLLTACQGCDHKRLEHARADPNFHGWERCFLCDCVDFYPDPFNERRAS